MKANELARITPYFRERRCGSADLLAAAIDLTASVVLKSIGSLWLIQGLPGRMGAVEKGKMAVEAFEQ